MSTISNIREIITDIDEELGTFSPENTEIVYSQPVLYFVVLKDPDSYCYLKKSFPKWIHHNLFNGCLSIVYEKMLNECNLPTMIDFRRPNWSKNDVDFLLSNVINDSSLKRPLIVVCRDHHFNKWRSTHSDLIKTVTGIFEEILTFYR